MYCTVGLRTSLLLILPCIYLFFFLSTYFVKDISTTVQDRNFKFSVQVHNDKLYRGIENGPSPICSSLYLFFFSFSPDFSSKISLQPLKAETLNLVYRFTTSCDVGLKMDILLFVLPCIFLSLYIFHRRYQPYALEALKRGYSQIFCHF